MGAVLGSLNYVLGSVEYLGLLLHFGNICIGKAGDVPLPHCGKVFIAKLDEVFPPEIRAYSIKLASPFIIGARVLLTILRFFLGGGGGGSAVKMMVAPGTGGAVKIPRPSFEADPRSYFRLLRGK